MKAKIHVTLKQGILDPQGKAIEHALDSLGFKNAGNVRVGKYMEVDVSETDKAKADAAVKAMCEKLLANTIGICIGQIHFVDGHNQGHTSSFGMIDRFAGLGHHAIVGGDHKNHDVSHFSAARTNGSEGFVARSIEEGQT